MENPISLKAYTRAALHAARYPLNDVFGVLVGEDSIEDAIPLFHNRALAPMLEVALQML